jgi:ribonuclease P/MRP protein subunit POP5
MVRFKNRHLLVEFLSPQSLVPTVTISNPAGPNDLEEMQLNGNADADGGDGEAEDDDEDDGLPLLPTIPFLAPSIGEHERLKLGDESGSTIYRAIKQSLLDVFGDEGWGRVSSSFKGPYNSLNRIVFDSLSGASKQAIRSLARRNAHS